MTMTEPWVCPECTFTGEPRDHNVHAAPAVTETAVSRARAAIANDPTRRARVGAYKRQIVTETDLRELGLLADSFVANSDLRVALLRIFDLAEDRPDIRAVAREALDTHKRQARAALAGTTDTEEET